MASTPPIRGRGTATNPHNRFAPNRSVAEDDGWYQEVPLTQGTQVINETAKTIITRNTSPDIPFDQSHPIQKSQLRHRKWPTTIVLA